MAEANILELWIPGAAVPKGRARATAWGGKVRTHTPAKTRNYENLIRLQAGEEMKGRALIEGPVTVRVIADIHIPQSWSKKKQAAALAGEIMPISQPDVDNYAKAALDALNKVVFPDDSQVVQLIAMKRYSARPGLTIQVISETPATILLAIAEAERRRSA